MNREIRSLAGAVLVASLLLVSCLADTELMWDHSNACSEPCPGCSWVSSLDVEYHPDGTASKNCCFSMCDYYPWCLVARSKGVDYSIAVSRSNETFLMGPGASAVVVDGLAMVCIEGGLDLMLAIGGEVGIQPKAGSLIFPVIRLACSNCPSECPCGSGFPPGISLVRKDEQCSSAVVEVMVLDYDGDLSSIGIECPSRGDVRVLDKDPVDASSPARTANLKVEYVLDDECATSPFVLNFYACDLNGHRASYSVILFEVGNNRPRPLKTGIIDLEPGSSVEIEWVAEDPDIEQCGDSLGYRLLTEAPESVGSIVYGEGESQFPMIHVHRDACSQQFSLRYRVTDCCGASIDSELLYRILPTPSIPTLGLNPSEAFIDGMEIMQNISVVATDQNLECPKENEVLILTGAPINAELLVFSNGSWRHWDSVHDTIVATSYSPAGIGALFQLRAGIDSSDASVTFEVRDTQGNVISDRLDIGAVSTQPKLLVPGCDPDNPDSWVSYGSSTISGQCASIGPLMFTMDPAWYEAGCLQFRDLDGDVLTFRVSQMPELGSVNLMIAGSNGNYFVTVMYEVDRDEMLACHRARRDLIDRLVVQATDPYGGVSEAEMVITFEVINTPPVCEDDTATTPSGVPVLIDVLANDSDPDEDPLTVVEVSTPSGGTTTIIGNRVGYIPDVGICGIDTFTYIADDGYGGQTTASVSVTVLDNVDPVAVCQNVTLILDSNGEATLDPTSLDGGSTDNCGIAGFSASQKNFHCAELGDVPVMMTVYDHAGNEDTCWATVIVVDDIHPEVVGRDLTVQLGANGQVTVAAIELDNGSSDNCSITTYWIDGAPVKTFTCTHRGINVVAFTVFDARGNSTSTNVSVTVEDVLPPTAVCQNITVSLDENGQVTVAASAVDGGSTDNCAIASLSLDRDTFTEADIGDQPVTLTVTDTSDNAATCEAVITVQDNTPPIITCPGDRVIVANPGQCYATGVDLGTPTATDNCEVDWDTLTNNAPAQYPVDVTVVTWSVDDVNGNTGTCTQQVQVTEPVDPIVNCPGDMMVQTHDPNGIVVTFTASASDNCDSNPQVSCSPASGSTFPVGDTLVTCTATDDSGNTDTCTFTVTVVFENDPPVALDDEATMPEGGGCITIYVLANDVDPDNDELEVISVGTPQCGTTAIINNGTAVRYCTEGCSDPPDEVTFSYTISDGHLGTDSAIVTVDMPEGAIIFFIPPPGGE